MAAVVLSGAAGVSGGEKDPLGDCLPPQQLLRLASGCADLSWRCGAGPRSLRRGCRTRAARTAHTQTSCGFLKSRSRCSSHGTETPMTWWHPAARVRWRIATLRSTTSSSTRAPRGNHHAPLLLRLCERSGSAPRRGAPTSWVGSPPPRWASQLQCRPKLLRRQRQPHCCLPAGCGWASATTTRRSTCSGSSPPGSLPRRPLLDRRGRPRAPVGRSGLPLSSAASARRARACYSTPVRAAVRRRAGL